MWMNHHEFVRWVRAVDYPFLFANGLLLLMVTFVPFPTAVMARYLGTDAAQAAVALYCASFFLTSVAFGVLYLSVAYKRRLVRNEVSDAALARVGRAYATGLVVYGVSVVLASWSPTAGLMLCASLWILWTRLCYGDRRELLQA